MKHTKEERRSPFELFDGRNVYWAAAITSILSIIVYLPSLSNEFINWDDDLYIYENPFIRSFDANLLKSAFLGFHAANWHPLTWLSHALDYAVWGLNPVGHHLTNVLLHGINSALVVMVVVCLMDAMRMKGRLPKRLSENRSSVIAGTVAGLLFGLHPLHVESVVWAAERKDLLCAFFYLLSLIVYSFFYGTNVEENKSRRTRLHMLIAGLTAAALMSKPMAVSIPLIFLVIDWAVFDRICSLKMFIAAIKEKISLFILVMISSVLTLFAQKSGGAMHLMDIVPLQNRLLIAVHSIAVYFLKTIVPLNLVPLYPYPQDIAHRMWEYFGAIMVVAVITFAAVYTSRKSRFWAAAWAYFLITLLPVIGVIQVGEQAMADRYMYLPSLGLFAAAGIACALAYERAFAVMRKSFIVNAAAILISLCIVLLLSLATVRQTSIWKNGTIFWNYVIANMSDKTAMPFLNLGNIYFRKGEYDSAIEQFKTALGLKGKKVNYHLNLGNAYAAKGMLDASIEQFKVALDLDPVYADAYLNLGWVYSMKGQRDIAIYNYRKAVELNPKSGAALYNLANAYAAKEQWDMAIEEYKDAARLLPYSADISFNLANAYAAKEQWNSAVEQYKSAIKLNPDMEMAHFNLGLAYLSKGDRDEAVQELELVLKLNPNNQRARQALGYIWDR